MSQAYESMNMDPIRPDIEGELVKFSGEESCFFGKRLPTGVAWHIFEPEDLVDSLNSVVQSVQTDLLNSKYLICYRPSMEPLDLSSLHEMLRCSGRLAAWRVSKVAMDLCIHLKALHELDIPQMIIHPERIGRYGKKLVLLPTMAGVLPPLSKLPSNEIVGWLHYIAPEILRTRGLDKEQLPSGDIFALGRTLWALCLPSWKPSLKAERLNLAEQQVELPQNARMESLPPEFNKLQELFDRMCAPLSARRPTLPQIIKVLKGILESESPEKLFCDSLNQKRLQEAEAYLKEMTADLQAGVFGVSKRSIHLLTASLAMAQSPPECQKAINELEDAESPKAYEADIQRRIGRAYALYTTHTQHLDFSNEAYKRAARLSDWDTEVLDEWAEVLEQFGNPDAVLKATDDVPHNAMSRKFLMVRTRCWMDRKAFLDAWMEIAGGFAHFEFDPKLFELAREIAQHINPTELLRWIPGFVGKPGLAALLSIIYEVNNNKAKAAQYLKQAVDFKP